MAEENIIKQRAIHKCNFTVLHNEILFQKLKEKPISLDALGLFWRILSLPPAWNLNQNGLMKICGCGKDKLKACFNELIEAGYLIKTQENNNSTGQFEPNTYYVFETVDKTLWNINNEDEIVDTKNAELQENKSPQADLPLAGKPSTEKPLTGNLPQYNMLINKENNIIKNYNNLSESESRFTPECSESEDFDNNNLTVLVKNNSNLINLETPKGCEKGSQKGQGAKIKKQQRHEILEQKRQEKIEAEINKPKTSLNNIVEETMSNLTEEDNFMARANKKLKEIDEKQKALDLQSQKKTGIKKRILAKVDKDIQNQELAVVLKDYLSMWITKGKTMTEEVYKAQLNNLYTLSRDPKEQVQIVKKSIQKGWLDLYPINNGSYKKETYKTQNQIYKSNIKQEENSEDYELATDENGNPLVF